MPLPRLGRSLPRSWSRPAAIGRSLPLSLVAVIVALALVGCGGSGTNGVAFSPAPPGTDVPFLGSPAAAGPAETVPTASPATSAAFCRDVQDLQLLLPVLLGRGAEAATLQQVSALVGRIQKDAPPDIRSAVNQVVATERRIVADLTASPPDLADVRRSFTDPAYQRALQDLGSYGFSHC